MIGSIATGTVAGMAAYVAMGGTNYALMIVVCLVAAIIGVALAERFS